MVSKAISLSMEVITGSFIYTRQHSFLFLWDNNHNDPRDNPKFYWLKISSFNPSEY